jgi:hypothetical protein
MKLATIRDIALTIASTAVTGAVAYALHDSRESDRRHRELDVQMADDRARWAADEARRQEEHEARMKIYSTGRSPESITPAL